MPSALAIPSIFVGGLTMAPMLVGDFFKDSITVVASAHPAMAAVAEHAAHPLGMALHGFATLPFWLAAAGVVVAWWFYLKDPSIPAAIDRKLAPLRTLLENKYYFDAFNEKVLAALARALGTGLWKGGDQALIDGALINGSARGVGALAGVVRRLQTGQLYWYALVMVVGIFGFLTWRLWPLLAG